MKRLAESRRKRADQPPSGEAHCERNGAQCKLPLRGGCLLSSIRGHDDSDLPLREQLSAESERVGRELQHTSPAPSPPTETVGTTPAESSPMLKISHPQTLFVSNGGCRRAPVAAARPSWARSPRDSFAAQTCTGC